LKSFEDPHGDRHDRYGDQEKVYRRKIFFAFAFKEFPNSDSWLFHQQPNQPKDTFVGMGEVMYDVVCKVLEVQAMYSRLLTTGRAKFVINVNGLAAVEAFSVRISLHIPAK
jgi:hypothetical protein